MILVFFAAVLLVVAKGMFQSNPPVPAQSSTVGLSTSSTAATNSTLLQAKDFQIIPQMGMCGYDTNGFKFDQTTAELKNNQSIAFHFLSAKIIFANYSLANGTVVQVNQESDDYTPTNGTLRTFNLVANFKVPSYGPKIIQMNFVITANVEEVAEPIVRLVPVTINC